MANKETHTYTQTHQLQGNVMSFTLGNEDAELRQQAAMSSEGRAAKTLVKEGRLRVSVLALQEGAQLDQHEIAASVTVQVLRCRLRVDASGKEVDAPAGMVIALDEGVPHAVTALEESGVLLTVGMPESHQRNQ
jgi:quercetin dioxygenase-like cupin family protein